MTRVANIEVLLDSMPSAPFTSLVRELARWCDVRASDPANPPPAARLANSPRAPGAREAAEDPHAPLAVWIDDPQVISALMQLGPALIIASRRVATELVSSGEMPDGTPVITFPDPGVEGLDLRATSPFVRSRLRRRFSLPDRLIIELGTPGAVLNDREAVTGLRLASAAVVVGQQALPALALGTPVVTNDATAAWLATIDDVHVLVRPRHEAMAAAEELCDDQLRAARLSREAITFVRAKHDPAVTARAVADRLGIMAAGSPVLTAIGVRLAELATPRGSLPSQRGAERAAELGPGTVRDLEKRVW